MSNTRAAARLASEGEAVGLDLSAPMLDRATRYAQDDGLTNVRFMRGDAQVHPFAADWFDVAISQFGVMFFTDPVSAFANIRQALRPGGRLTFVCPQAADRCEWFQAPGEAFGATGRTPNEGMFSLADPDLIARILTAAGYLDVHIQPLTTSLFFGRDVSEAVAFFIGSGPARALLESGAVTEADVVAELDPVLRRYADNTGVRIPGRHWLVRAERGA